MVAERPDYDFCPPEAALDALLEVQARLGATGFVDEGTPPSEVVLTSPADGTGVASDPTPEVVLFRGALPET